MKKLVLCLTFIIFVFVFTEVDVEQAYAYSCSAKSMVVIETNNNRILYSSNEKEKLPMASTTKIMTAITVINHCKNLDEVVDITRPSTIIEGTSIYLQVEEKPTVRQLLYGLMLRSGNDAAHALAVHIGGSEEGFVDLMNDLAVDIGAFDTHFANPHGLDDKDHYTTAIDLAIITSYALKNPIFKEIVSTKSYLLKGDNVQTRSLKNKNRLLSSLDGCIGVKTGYTNRAGRCLVTACERDGMQVVCVVLNCGPMFEESVELIDEAFEEYTMHTIIEDYTIVSELPVSNSPEQSVKVYAKNGYKAILKNNELANINVSYDLVDKVVAPKPANEIVGEIQIYLDKDLLFETNLYTLEEVNTNEPKAKLKDILDNWYKG